MGKIDLMGKTALVTGGSMGLGKTIAAKLLNHGANVMICSRSAAQARNSANEIMSTTGKSEISSMCCDVSEPEQVEKLIDCVLSTFSGIHILINNAGIYGPKGLAEQTDWLQWKKAIEINLYGSVLVSRAVIPIFKKQNYGKIIQLSGGGATGPLPMLSSYAASKAAIVRYIETLAKELDDFRIDVNSIAPGALNTRMLDQVLAAGPDLVGQAMFSRSEEQAKKGGASLSIAADLVCFLSSSLSDGLSGKLVSAVWDNWDEMSDHAKDISNSDVLTLRRLNGKAAGMDWIDK